MRKVIVWLWQSLHLLNLSNVPDWEVHCRPICMVWVSYTLWLYNNIYPYQGFPWRTNLSVLAHVSTNDPQDELTLRHTGRTQCLSKWINPQPYFIVSNIRVRTGDEKSLNLVPSPWKVLNSDSEKKSLKSPWIFQFEDFFMKSLVNDWNII